MAVDHLLSGNMYVLTIISAKMGRVIHLPELGLPWPRSKGLESDHGRRRGERSLLWDATPRLIPVSGGNGNGDVMVMIW